MHGVFGADLRLSFVDPLLVGMGISHLDVEDVRYLDDPAMLSWN